MLQPVHSPSSIRKVEADIGLFHFKPMAYVALLKHMLANTDPEVYLRATTPLAWAPQYTEIKSRAPKPRPYADVQQALAVWTRFNSMTLEDAGRNSSSLSRLTLDAMFESATVPAAIRALIYDEIVGSSVCDPVALHTLPFIHDYLNGVPIFSGDLGDKWYAREDTRENPDDERLRVFGLKYHKSLSPAAMDAAAQARSYLTNAAYDFRDYSLSSLDDIVPDLPISGSALAPFSEEADKFFTLQFSPFTLYQLLNWERLSASTVLRPQTPDTKGFRIPRDAATFRRSIAIWVRLAAMRLIPALSYLRAVIQSHAWVFELPGISEHMHRIFGVAHDETMEALAASKGALLLPYDALIAGGKMPRMSKLAENTEAILVAGIAPTDAKRFSSLRGLKLYHERPDGTIVIKEEAFDMLQSRVLEDSADWSASNFSFMARRIGNLARFERMVSAYINTIPHVELAELESALGLIPIHPAKSEIAGSNVNVFYTDGLLANRTPDSIHDVMFGITLPCAYPITESGENTSLPGHVKGRDVWNRPLSIVSARKLTDSDNVQEGLISSIEENASSLCLTIKYGMKTRILPDPISLLEPWALAGSDYFQGEAQWALIARDIPQLVATTSASVPYTIVSINRWIDRGCPLHDYDHPSDDWGRILRPRKTPISSLDDTEVAGVFIYSSDATNTLGRIRFSLDQPFQQASSSEVIIIKNAQPYMSFTSNWRYVTDRLEAAGVDDFSMAIQSEVLAFWGCSI